jgi:TRAP-type C4-dicarboxylate transport system permease small subunit
MFSKLLVRCLEWILILVLGFMVVLVFGNVVLRYGFNSGITFSEEVSRFLFVWMVFLGAVLTLRDNGHLGVHTLTKMLPLAGKKFCKLISDVTVLACCVLLSIGAWQIIGLNMANIAPISGIPLGVVYMACMFCSVGMGILLLGSIYRLLSGTMTEQEMCPDFDDAL